MEDKNLYRLCYSCEGGLPETPSCSMGLALMHSHYCMNIMGRVCRTENGGGGGGWICLCPCNESGHKNEVYSCRIDGLVNGIIKVADFGLAEDMYGTKYYQRSENEGRERVPIRWMAPESIDMNIYNEATDVVSQKIAHKTKFS